MLAYRTTSCMDPMELYQPEVNEEDESTQDVTAPEVEFMGTEEVFSVLPEITTAMMSPRKRRLEVKETLKQTRNIETLSLYLSFSLFQQQLSSEEDDSVTTKQDLVISVYLCTVYFISIPLSSLSLALVKCCFMSSRQDVFFRAFLSIC